MKAAVASIVFLVTALLVFLLGAEAHQGVLFWAALLAAILLSIAFALLAVVFSATGKELDGTRRLAIVVIALPFSSSSCLRSLIS